MHPIASKKAGTDQQINQIMCMATYQQALKGWNGWNQSTDVFPQLTIAPKIEANSIYYIQGVIHEVPVGRLVWLHKLQLDSASLT